MLSISEFIIIFVLSETNNGSDTNIIQSGIQSHLYYP